MKSKLYFCLLDAPSGASWQQPPLEFASGEPPRLPPRDPSGASRRQQTACSPPRWPERRELAAMRQRYRVRLPVVQPVRQHGSSGWAGSSDFQRTHPAQPLASTGCLASSQFEFEFKKPTCFPGDLAPKHCYPLTFLFIHHRYNTFHINWMHINSQQP
jgi:hypothetical protein